MGWATHAIAKLQTGETVVLRPRGHSMTGRVDDGDVVTVEPYGEAEPRVDEVVLVKVRGQDLKGEELTLEGEGLLARAFCHEIDHLDGKLFLERLGVLKRDLIKRKIRKKIRQGDW